MDWEDDQCTDITLDENIVAGAFSNGFGHDGFDCEDTSISFTHNIAHSVEGDGFVIVNPVRKPRKEQDNCFAAGYMCAYKNTGYGVISYDYGHELQFRDMILIDNHYGTGTFLAKEEDDKTIKIIRNKYYGELPLHTKDCDSQLLTCDEDPNDCDRFAIILPIFTTDANWPFNLEGLPNDYIRSDATWGGKTQLDQVEFYHFKPGTSCGGRERIFGLHRLSTDYIPAIDAFEAAF